MWYTSRWGMVFWIGLIVLLSVGLAACGGDDDDNGNDTNQGEGGLTVNDPWVRPTLGDGDMGEGESGMVTGAFMAIANTSDQADKLVAVRISDEIATTVEIHETTIGENDVMQMRPVEEIEVPAKGNLVLKPGSYHIMLLDVQLVLEPGDMVALTLVFESGTEIDVDAEVRTLE